MRVSQNSDALPIARMMYLVDKMELCQDLMQRNGWVMGKVAKGYSMQRGGDDKDERDHMDAGIITDSEHLVIMNKAALDAREGLMTIANVQRKTLHPLMQDFKSMSQLADVVEAFFKSKKAEADNDDEAAGNEDDELERGAENALRAGAPKGQRPTEQEVVQFDVARANALEIEEPFEEKLRF